MRKKQFSTLNHIEHDRELSMETDVEFLFQLQKGLLLALKEEGIVTQMQYRYADNTLSKQQQERITKGR